MKKLIDLVEAMKKIVDSVEAGLMKKIIVVSVSGIEEKKIIESVEEVLMKKS